MSDDKRMIRSIFVCLYFFLPCLAFSSPPEAIRVQLTTESSFTPIYLSKISSAHSAFPASYLSEIEGILQYDFQYNGTTKVIPSSPEKEQWIHAQLFTQFQIPFVVSFSLQGTQLCTHMYDIKQRSAKRFPEVPLTGILSEDRKKLHKLSDMLFQVLFSTEGIASSRIVFAYEKKDQSGRWISEIAECDWDGANIQDLTREESYCINPVLVPKSAKQGKEQFFYVCYKFGQPKIFLATKGEKKGRRVCDIRGNQMLPALSQQKDQLAFICDASGRADLFVQAIHPETGTMHIPKQLFSFPRSTQGSPTFSPDGTKIAFVSDKDGSPRIYWIPSTPKGSRATAHMITKKNKESTCPAWSPDGTKIAYSAKTKGIRQIWIYDFATGEERQLTFGSGNKENPAWAPNSQHIVFNSTDEEYCDLYRISLTQSEAVRITKGPGKKHYPAWGSR